jgi:signal transduction histidine kinase/ligand-binding sensor domain-containing protein
MAEAQITAARALVALGTLYVLLWCPYAFALDPALDVSQYAHTAWTYRDGQGAVYAITQTPDGFLWLATQSGVARFDGVRAVPLPLPPEQQLPSTGVTALLTARDGTLWIGTLNGLASWKNGQLTEYPALARGIVIALLQDRAGTVWAGGLAGPRALFCAISGGSTTCHGDDGILGAAVGSLYEDAAGSLWVGAATGLWRWNPGPPTRYLATPIRGGQTLTQGDHGSGLIAAIDSVRQIAGTRVTNYPLLHGVPSLLTAKGVLRDRNGGLWIGTTAHGIVHSYQGRTSTFNHNDGLSSDEVNALFEDREGTIWIGTSDGLDRFRELTVTSLSVQEGLSSATANSVLAARDGSLWIGTTDGLDRRKDGRTTIYRRRSDPALPDDTVQSLFEDERGRIWVSGFRGLAAFEKGRFTAVPSIPEGFKHAIAGDGHGGLWLSLWGTANDYGLAHLVDDKIIEQVSWQKLGGGPGTGLVPDPDGGVWTGLLSGGLAHFHAGKIRNLPLSDDRGVARRVFEISRDRDGSIWAATENGLSRIKDGHVATLTTANGLPCNTVLWIIEGDLSSYWIYTQCGLLRIARTELEAWTADPTRTIRPTVFGVADGVRLVPINKGARPAATKSSDGKIWFVNGDAVSFIDPARIVVNPLPPPVHIEQITADGKAYDASRGLRLPPLVRNLVIDYTALSLVTPERLHFRFKLEGQDPDWREVVNERKVQYSNLAPGNYRFRVTASNNSGVWNQQGDVRDFSIPPAYYQTNWFRALCAASLLTLLWAAYQFRVRQLQHEFDLTLEARVAERTRIARDLHDTLLQSAHGVLLRFQIVSQLLPESPVEAKGRLDSAIEQTAEFITEARDHVQELRTSTVQSNDLAMAISTLGQELATNGRSATFDVVVEGKPRNLHPIVRDEIYKIAAESLRNAFQHAEPQRVVVEIRYDNALFQLRVRDDGRGIDPAILSRQGSEGHYGLPGMRERATGVGGKLTVWSAVNEGTEVELCIPASAAYATERSSWFLRRFAKRTRA